LFRRLPLLHKRRSPQALGDSSSFANLRRRKARVVTYPILRLLHIIGAMLIGAGLIGVWFSDLRSRQVRDLPRFSEAIRNIAIFYDGLVVPGALLLLGSGTWLIVTVYGGWSFHFLKIPWLAGMVVLFTFEFIEGNTVTRLYFQRLLRLTRAAIATGQLSPALQQARAETLPTFTHFLDLPLLMVIVSLGATRPNTWMVFFVGTGVAVLIATALTIILPRLHPWAPVEHPAESTRDGIAQEGAGGNGPQRRPYANS
jgi:uncharacterized membrane protein